MPTIAGDGEGPFAQNVKIFRMSEAKLNKIEALYKMGSNSEALIELNNALEESLSLFSGLSRYFELGLEHHLV